MRSNISYYIGAIYQTLNNFFGPNPSPSSLETTMTEPTPEQIARQELHERLKECRQCLRVANLSRLAQYEHQRQTSPSHRRY